ncbi:hypothetical protein KEM56_002026 [Ascosphaera pollenicola]|nr:hypothetical protein KEM56_002026 [Ascosphaera pollenicola]
MTRTNSQKRSLTGIICQKIIPVKRFGPCPRRLALHPIPYHGHLEIWEDFEELALAAMKAHENELKATNGHKDPAYRIGCADEEAVRAHFLHTAIAPMNGVSHVMKWDCYWATAGAINLDLYKPAIQDQLLKPDIVCVDKTGRVKVVGEMKTPWSHPLTEWWNTVFGDGTDPGKYTMFLKLIGQVRRYMQVFEVNVGFVSTNDKTVFVKLDTVDGVEVIKCSRPIADKQQVEEGRVSVRSGLFFSML